MSLLKTNEIQVFNGTTVTITATVTETSADLNVGADLDVTGALTLGTALAIAEGGTGAADAATARTNLDVDQAGTDNSTDVTLVTTSHDYLSITGQAITLGPIDLAADVTGSLPYASISGTPTLGTAAAEDVGYFATAAQGALADSAVQPGDDADTLGSGAATDGYVLTADGAGGAAWEAKAPIDLLSSGASIRKSDGTTAVLSESGGAVTLENVTNLEADSITDKAGTGAPDFPNGLTLAGNTTGGNITGVTLDSYEEGTYTVTLYDASSGGNASSTTTTGYYTKIGRVVTCSFDGLTNISTAGMTTTNVLYMSLPFPAAQDSSSGTLAYSLINTRQGTGEGQMVPFVLSGNSRARFYGCQADAAVASIRPAELTSGTSDILVFSMTYIV